MKDKLKLAVLGSPIAHSRSPQLQSSFAHDIGIADFSYERIEVTEETLLNTIERLRDEGYDGFNCTMPLKTEMARLAHECTLEVKTLISANTVAIRDGKFYADTTDGIGILFSIRRALGEFDKTAEECVKGKKAVLIGAGGAARSAALSLKNAGARLTVLNRTLSLANELSDMIGGCECLGLNADTLYASASGADILINCTSLGMKGKAEFESLDFIKALPSSAIVIDAVYEPLETAFLRCVRARGLSAVSGLWMLVYQGAAAFEKWSGIMPDEDACVRAFETIK